MHICHVPSPTYPIFTLSTYIIAYHQQGLHYNKLEVSFMDESHIVDIFRFIAAFTYSYLCTMMIHYCCHVY